MPITWDPQQYARFAGHRERPFFDLTSRIDADAPGRVVDLGCGAGPLTLHLAHRWPGARVVGVDSSPPMIEQARDADPDGRVEWVEADLVTWRAEAPVDVLVTNAALQWVPTHLDLLPRLIDQVAPGGWFAMQVPGNFDAPSHALLREVAARMPRADELVPRLRGAYAVAEPTAYAAVLADAGMEVDVWETTYLQMLDPQGQQADPVLEWTKGTALRPVLEVLTGEQERTEFMTAYAESLRQAYPRRRHGTPFPFRRIFAVGHRREG
jgi:trans-aconitate 2-methyltransferase